MGEKFLDKSVILLCLAVFCIAGAASYDLVTRDDEPAATPAVSAEQADARLIVGLSEVIASQQVKIRDLEHDCKLLWGIIQEATKSAPSVHPSGPCISADVPGLEEMEVTP